MPRKTKNEAVITKATAATKAKTKIQTNTKTTATKKSVIETPKGSRIILEYRRNGNLGFSTVKETVSIPFLTKKKFAGKITSLFHFIRQTEVCKSLDPGRTATFAIDGKPVLSIIQKAGNYDEQVFSVTKYKADGTKQSTRKYDYGKTRNLILQAYGFEVKDDESEGIVEEQMLDIDNCMELLPDTDFDNDTDYGFNDME